MSTDGIDGCWIGPSDLAASMGVPFNSPEHLTAIDQIVEICKQTNKSLEFQMVHQIFRQMNGYQKDVCLLLQELTWAGCLMVAKAK